MSGRVLTLRELNRATLARQGLLARWSDAGVSGALEAEAEARSLERDVRTITVNGRSMSS